MLEIVMLVLTLVVPETGEFVTLSYDFGSVDECMAAQAEVLAGVPEVTAAECAAVFDPLAPAAGEVRS